MVDIHSISVAATLAKKPTSVAEMAHNANVNRSTVYRVLGRLKKLYGMKIIFEVDRRKTTVYRIIDGGIFNLEQLRKWKKPGKSPKQPEGVRK